jgi:hypothetical protein
MAARPRKTPKKQRRVKTTLPRQPGQPWTIPELSRELRVSDQYLYDRARKGELEVLPLDGVFRVSDAIAQQLLGNT